MGDEYKFIKDVKLFIALWEDTPTNRKRLQVTECIENGADVNVRFATNANNTPLHLAVIKGDKDIVNVLLTYGANTNIANDAGKTALQLAEELSERSHIAEILIAHRETELKVEKTPVTTSRKCEYKKRPGTANVRGQLYETKLLTTIFLRILRCKQIEEFYLGTNVDEIGDLDDVCLRLRTRNEDSVIFLQAKYKHDVVKGKVQDLWRPNGDFSVLKYFESYLKIREKFHPDSDDKLFQGRYDAVKCYFVIYTTVKDEIKNTYKKLVSDHIVHSLLRTGNHENIFQFTCEEQYVEILTNAKLLEQVKNLGKKLIKFIQDQKYDNMILCDENMRNFHVVLAQKVIKVSGINEDGQRTGTFREEFFSSNEQLLIILRDTLYAEIVKNNKMSAEEIEASIRRISDEPTAENIANLIGNVLVYDNNNGTLKMADKSFEYQCQLVSRQVAQSEIIEAFQIAGRRKLQKLIFKLPAAFGNLDMTINKKKSGRRLEYLARKICDAVKNWADEEGNVALREGAFAADKQLEAGILGLNGGIAGAVGNLLLAHDENKLIFNLDTNSLGENARMLQLMLREKLGDLSKYRFFVEIEDFPRLSLRSTEHEKRYARDFLKNLYFYTYQAKEENLEGIATNELQFYESGYGLRKSEWQIKSNALFLKIHNEIQIWWMMDQSVYYLTRNMDKIDKIFNEFNNKGLLSFLNYVYLKDVYNASVEFKAEALDVLSACKPDAVDQRMIVVHTDAHMLTSHKLVQLFKDMVNCIFVNIDYICKVSPNCLETIVAELGELDIHVVIIICENICAYSENIISACEGKKIILIATHLAPKNNKVIVNDNRVNLLDLTETSQSKVLQTVFVYQGVEVTFAEVFDEAKHLITAKILQKIIKNESIILGQTLESATYKDMQQYYVPRVLERNTTYNYVLKKKDLIFSSQQFSPSTLFDHYGIFKSIPRKTNNDVILIIDAPGMGKSTLLTHLSLETKRKYPKTWVHRINLIDYTKQFHEWQENKTEIDIVEALKFLCKTVLLDDVFKSKVGSTNTDVIFELINDKPKLVSYDVNCPLKLFKLKTFLNCFEEKNIVFLFDGFDEISPHYKSEVTQLLKCLAHGDESYETDTCTSETRAGRCVWITSRPYNDLKDILMAEFGDSFTLLPFSYYDTNLFVNKYMRRNLNISMMTTRQMKNVWGFLEYMKRFDLRSSKLMTDTLNITNVQLHGIYMAAVEYFKAELKMNCLFDNLAGYEHLDFQEDVLLVWKLFQNEADYVKSTTLSGVPLNIYIAVHYFLSQIKDTTDMRQEKLQWDLDSNTFAFYERFIETKLKTIRFEGKSNIDMYNPDMRMTYEREMKEFQNNHKKLACYAVFEGDLLTDVELEEVISIMKGMENGKDKTGLVDRIVDGKPKFVHNIFAEYFAVEHIFEILKTGELDNKKRMVDFILNDMIPHREKGFQVMFDLKLKCTSGLTNTITGFCENLNKHIFQIILKQSREMDQRKFHARRYSTVLDILIKNNLVVFMEFLMDAIINVVDVTNVVDFLSIIEESLFIKQLDNKKIMNKIMNCIISVEPIKFYSILRVIYAERMPSFFADM
ncbi:uncharacterized protein LOC115440882 [Manduca sexta]|uniref:NACHT domain-containing protein n=1 Tax=Manduca sexta TaxID=7130 RepID=A0A921YVA5_MANSE|nr:uncharacterized protein LOC115440882 [Manduca sexta]KAG6446047.1 hypothetical protein O3G_MSEX004269 [Manduca sexta]KAG6446048.1 hypothetical protein O3G_MSEX004269 [Manduca sexta]KAG6446049.1 hypothetical protein O3G_MSEX004269 [Manduca sexta]